MTDAEKIVLLRAALKNLVLSADRYIDDGSWLNDMLYDIQHARDLIKRIEAEK